MRIMKSNGGFIDFVKSRSGLVKAFAVLLVGLSLLLFGRLARSTAKAPEEPCLEERLAEACSALEAAGECSVMITYGDGGEVEGVLILCEVPYV